MIINVFYIFFNKKVNLIETIISISPSSGHCNGRFAASNQNAGHVPKPFGNLALYSIIPYLKLLFEINLADVYSSLSFKLFLLLIIVNFPSFT